jgi:hypothetical protein
MSYANFTEQSATPSTPAAGKVVMYFDNTANPQMKFVDDAGNVQTVADNNNTLTMANKTLTSPNIGVATGTSLAVTGALTSSSPSAGIGYATGAGGTVTQGTSKSTAVTMSPNPCLCGKITMHNEALAAGAEATFTVTDSAVAAADVVIVNIQSVGTTNAYLVSVSAVTAGTFTINISNVSAGSLSEALVLNFIILKAVIS